MVTIRNDIETNGYALRAPDGSASATFGGLDGVKNVNHLSNGSRRSTMMDLKSKTFNRKCVGFLTLVLCVGVCFGVGMLFLYGHLVDRLNESAISSTMWHDKDGNPVKVISSSANVTPVSTVDSTTIPSSTEAYITTEATLATTPSTTTSTSTSTSKTYLLVQSTTDKQYDGFDLDSKQNSKKDGEEVTSAKTDIRVENSSERNRAQHIDEEDSEGSTDGSGYGSGNDYENDQPYEGSGRRH